jgi:hypothetical protein
MRYIPFLNSVVQHFYLQKNPYLCLDVGLGKESYVLFDLLQILHIYLQDNKLPFTILLSGNKQCRLLM